jgi:spore coat protein JB
MEQMTQEQLLLHITEVSFVITDMLLYLDTHPDEQQALDFIKDHIVMRNNALKIYSRLYGPLTIDTADDNASNSWEWVNTPWPWEGRCR